ncbi:MAG TPA: hypothetical protein VJP79_11745 [Nitrososphaera sp.]|nr:hypothetical protein [Nitrososphaera sp.]
MPAQREQITQKKVTSTYISGANSATLVIPKSVAMEHGLTSPSNVVVESVNPGYVIPDKAILIRRLDI